MAKWVKIDKYNDNEHHFCSYCENEANYYDVFKTDYEYDWDENLVLNDPIHVGIKEFLTPYCPWCGSKMHNFESTLLEENTAFEETIKAGDEVIYIGSTFTFVGEKFVVKKVLPLDFDFPYEISNDDYIWHCRREELKKV